MKNNWIEIFKEKNALLSGHFLLSSGKHSADYFQCALILQYPDIAEKIAIEIAKQINFEIDAVVSPAMGGIIIGQEMGRALKKRAVFTEREDGIMKLRRGFSIAPGERVLVVEDVLTTGKSSKEVIKLLEENNAKVSALACVVDRSVGKVDLGVPVFPLIKLPVEIYEPDSCSLCKQGMPVVKPGSRK